MKSHHLKLRLMPQKFSVCQLRADAAIPRWARKGEFLSITRTGNELSIVCESRLVPASVKAEKGFRCFELQGPFPFAMTGVLASVLEPLARARVSIFAVSTYDTDYVMVKERQLAKSVKALRAAGHQVSTL